MKCRALALALFLSVPSPAAAEWYVKPFLGLTFGGGTTFVDLEQAIGEPNIAYGIGVQRLGEVFGVEAEVAYAPGTFDSGDLSLVLRSSTTTVMGNLMVALPGRATAYNLRPYFVAGLGMIRVRKEDFLDAFSVRDKQPAFNIGGGAMGVLSGRFGLSWDLRYFRRLPREDRGLGFTFGSEELSFWRAYTAVVFRY